MSNLEVIRAWKDPEFRATLDGVVPDHPAGQIEFIDPLLDRNSAAKLQPLDLSHPHNCQITHNCTKKCA